MADTLAAALPREMSSALRAQITRQAGKLLALQWVDEAGLLVFGDDAGGLVFERSLSVRLRLSRTAILGQTLVPDTLDRRSFFRRQPRAAAVIATHGHLPLCSGRRDLSDARAFLCEVAGDASRSESRRSQEARHG